MINSKLVQFLQSSEVESLLAENNFEEIYRLFKSYKQYYASTLTEILLSAGVDDILFHMRYVPAEYAIALPLKEVFIPSNVREVESTAFSYCRKLERVLLSEGLERIGTAAFQLCENLSEIRLPNSLESVGKAAFGGTSLKSIEIPERVTTIEGGCFEDCTQLKSIMFRGTKSLIIRANAFYNCQSLSDVNFAGTKEQWRRTFIYKEGNEPLYKNTIHCSDGDVRPQEVHYG